MSVITHWLCNQLPNILYRNSIYYDRRLQKPVNSHSWKQWTFGNLFENNWTDFFLLIDKLIQKHFFHNNTVLNYR